MGYVWDAENEAAMADALGIPWDVRGPDPTELPEVLYHKGEKRRPDGTFRTASGWEKKVAMVWNASNHDPRFSKHSKAGQPLHGCAYSVVSKVAVTTATHSCLQCMRFLTHSHSFFCCVCVFAVAGPLCAIHEGEQPRSPHLGIRPGVGHLGAREGHQPSAVDHGQCANALVCACNVCSAIRAKTCGGNRQVHISLHACAAQTHNTRCSHLRRKEGGTRPWQPHPR